MDSFTFSLPLTKEPFSLSRLIDCETNKAVDELTRRFPPCLRSTHLLGKQKGVFYIATEQEQRATSSRVPSNHALKQHAAGGEII